MKSLHLIPLLTIIAMLTNAAADPAPAPAPATPAPPQQIEIKRLPNADLQLGAITVHRKERQLSFAATLNMNSGSLEVLIASMAGRLHESLLATEASPLHLQTLLYLIGLKNGPRLPDAEGNQGDLVDIDLEWQQADGTTRREPVENWITDTRTKQAMRRIGWVFVGSSVEDGAFLAEVNGNLCVLYSVGDTVLDIPDRSGDDDIYFIVNETKTEPALEASVRVIITPRTKPNDQGQPGD